MGGILEKPQLINFVAKILEDSGFKVYKNFETSTSVVDIYAVLPTSIGDFGVVLACNNQSKEDKLGIQLLKDTEKVASDLKASKIAIVTSAYFSDQTINYASKKNIKLVDRDNLREMAEKYKSTSSHQSKSDDDYDSSYVRYDEEEFSEYSYDASDMEYLARRKHENSVVGKNSLYPLEEQPNNNFSIFNREKPSLNSVSPYNNYLDNVEKEPLFDRLQPILGNPVVSIIVVVLFSYLISHLFSSVLGFSYGVAGLIEMIVALILSYGLTFLFADRSKFFITRGTAIFFSSLIILIALIFI